MSGSKIRKQMHIQMRISIHQDSSELKDRVAVRYRHYRRTQQRRKIREEIASLSGMEPREYILYLRKETGHPDLVLSNQEILQRLKAKH